MQNTARFTGVLILFLLLGATIESYAASILPNVNSSPNSTSKISLNPWTYGSFDESFEQTQNAVDSTIVVEPSISEDQIQPLRTDTTSTPVMVSETTRVSGADTLTSRAGRESGVEESVDTTSITTSLPEARIPKVTDVISVSKVFMTLVVLLIVWMGTRFISTVLTNMSERFQNHRLMIKRIIPVFKVSIWSLGLYFVIAGILQPPLETIITVSASVGIAVGFASQDILKNVFGGIMIILDKPFQVGDKIQVDGNYGEVTEIGLRSVRVVTEDDSIVTIPNAEIMNKSVSNSNSSALDCQVVAELYLESSIDINLVTDVCRKAAMTSRYTYLNKPIFVHAVHGTLGPRDFIKIRLKAYVLDIRFEQELRTDMTNLAMSELRRLGLLRN
jgi:small-conductance mechanosensitive channel